MTMPHPEQGKFANLDNWWSEPDGANIKYTYKIPKMTKTGAERLADRIVSALGIPVDVLHEREGDEEAFWIVTRYRPNCHVE